MTYGMTADDWWMLFGFVCAVGGVLTLAWVGWREMTR